MKTDSSSQKRRSKRRSKKAKTDHPGIGIWVDRFWGFFVKKEVVGLLCLIIGGVFILSPSTVALQEPTRAWFVTPFFNVDAIRTGVSLLVLVSFLLAGLGIDHYYIGSSRRRIRQHTRTFGAIIIVASICISIFAWASFHFFLPVSRISLSVGQSIESIAMHHLYGRTKVMLPLTTTLEKMDLSRETVTLGFKKKKDEEGISETIHASDPIVAGNYRFALLGFEYDPRYLQANLSTSGETAVVQAGRSVGSRVKFKLDDEEGYKVVTIAKNYLGVMGPAVQLESEKTGKFWVFQRGSDQAQKMTHNIHVLSVESSARALISVSDSRFSDFVSPMGVFFLIGVLIFIGSRSKEEIMEGDS